MKMILTAVAFVALVASPAFAQSSLGDTAAGLDEVSFYQDVNAYSPAVTGGGSVGYNENVLTDE